MADFNWKYVILDKPDETGNVLDWAMELQEAEVDLMQDNMYGAIFRIDKALVNGVEEEQWNFVKEVWPVDNG